MMHLHYLGLNHYLDFDECNYHDYLQACLLEVIGHWLTIIFPVL